ncbi:ECF transporter S component [Latilactobacillus sakei]|uniref:ECF transporter S component n=1 Tax=Latilactobacillus sakei TaxID=1599 RepID=UPI001EE3EA3B|nr:ECF transporter S component [Latilactobacillus sakei]
MVNQDRLFGVKLDTRRVVLLAVLIALQLVIARFAISLTIYRISFGFIVTALMGWWFGPVWAGLAAVLGDLINSLMIGVRAAISPVSRYQPS